MWFSNIFFYKFTKPFSTEHEQLEKNLAELAFVDCGATDYQRFGWAPALGHKTKGFTHVGNGCIYINAKKQVKTVPPQVVQDLLDEKIDKIHANEDGRPVKKKERQAMKEDIVHSLLPQAFPKNSNVTGYIDTNNDLLVINASSKNIADDFMALLRKSIGSLPVEPIRKDGTIETLLTAWLKLGALPAEFTLGTEATLISPEEDGAGVNLSHQDLLADEVCKHLDAGKQVTKLAVMWQDRITFTICNDLSIKKVKFSNLIKEQNDDISTDDRLAKMDADFVLMAAELGELLPYMILNVGSAE